MNGNSIVMMVKPFRFRGNEQTAGTNAFQSAVGDGDIHEEAWREFGGLVELLRREGVEVWVFEDDGKEDTPDSIFPNNWVSFHGNMMILYPMLAENRRKEKRPYIIEELRTRTGNPRITDLSMHEKRNLFLEGTGSLVFDPKSRLAYASLSPRTDEGLCSDVCRMLAFTHIFFSATDRNGNAIYHTNVVMCVGEEFAVIGSECIVDVKERERVLSFLMRSGKEVIELSMNQIENFAGNMYELENSKGEKLILMSDRAYSSLDKQQLERLANHGKLIHCDLKTIETYSGGSARCMIAHVNLEKE